MTKKISGKFAKVSAAKVTRRTFIVASAAAGGGLALGFNAPFGIDAASAQEAGAEVNAWVVIKPDDTTVIRIADVKAGDKIVTIEGLSANSSHPVQKAWATVDVPQCGYCQSGQIMAAAALLKKNPKPTNADIDEAMTNICRCGTYQRIRAAVHMAATNRA